ncbi:MULTISPECIES: hypothetical protein [unclassified Streptomyces]|uniref:hypothetical protein n=1 Tax=unclassified Streptomyces TaxID=2593676 RepID=UPI00278BD0AA|nr:MULTISPECIES: hypothetical protein [unclassified Streptomyces]
MSIAQDLRTRAKHRGMSPWELVKKIGRLERELAAKDREADGLACQLVQLATEIDGLKRERNQLQEDFDRAAIEYSGALEDVHTRDREIASLKAELAPHRAAQANRDAVTVPPMERDTTAVEDQATAPAGIDVKPLWEALATSPAHVPSWAHDTDTRPLRTLKEAS